MKRLGDLWDQWLPTLSVYKMVCGKISYLLVWLPEEVEELVDRTWKDSPSDGFFANTLAQYMCMQAVNEMIPQVETVGCAPAPRPTESLRDALKDFDLSYSEEMDVLTRRFAVVTFYPFRGGCEICHLQKHCPKGNGETGTSVVLPGFEKR
ncbi:MAG: hypothetical protein Q4F72_06880, partial [Desulfovibrionaceae bacterium]|nr:hypothetical protein [Desulfovibrionaceae bacterium]